MEYTSDIIKQVEKKYDVIFSDLNDQDKELLYNAVLSDIRGLNELNKLTPAQKKDKIKYFNELDKRMQTESGIF